MNQPAAQDAGYQFEAGLSRQIPHHLAPKAYAIDRVSPVIGEIGVIGRPGQPVVIEMPGGIGSQIIQRWQRTQPLPHPLIQHAAGEQGVVTGLVHEYRQTQLAPRQQYPDQ